AGEQLDRVAIANARERTLHVLELRDVALERLQFFFAAIHRAADEVFDELLRQLLQSVELEERNLRLDHPELHQMAARFRLLSAERRTEAVDLSERGGGRLEIELAGLREIRF